MQQPAKYPVGLQDFGKIREGGYVYVDKTALIRRLVDGGSYYFLSRPRRFGKSLLLSTIAAYFRGEQELFKGLAIAEHTDEWPQHPVLHLDLGGQKYNACEDLDERLDWHLKRWEEQYGITNPGHSTSLRFASVIERACQRTGRQVVILVDEYDKPLLESAGNEALQEHYRATLRAFYSNLKSCDAFIKFALLTGVTKFSKLSVFSDLNNLSDISMQREYAAICGITEGELEKYFADGIAELAQQNELSVEEARARLKKQYDGYLFHPKAEHVYNPFSLLGAFSKNELGDYWFESGTPNFLVKMLQRHNFDFENLSDEPISANRLNALDTLSSNPLPILYQSGYLTLGGMDDMNNYYLRFPNAEVERGFLQALVPIYAAKDGVASDALITRIVRGLRAGKPEDFMRELQALLADLPYEQGRPPEAYFRNLLFIIFRLVGFYCEVEHPLAGGRSDMVIKTDKYIYLLELKTDQSAAAALAQIEAKAYAAPYAADERKLFKIGLNFSTEAKQINEWQVV